MESSLELHHRLLSKIEGLARRVLEGNIRSAQDGWQFEVDLVRFQLEQQRAIADENAARREVNASMRKISSARLEDWKAQLQQCQDELRLIGERIVMYDHAYHVSRKLGDALAWILLDWTKIVPLMQAPSVPTADGHRVPEGHGLQGMLAVAELLYNIGIGFPLLHDITDSLRVGDITFVTRDCDPLTIEVKTHFKRSEGDRVVLGIEIYTAGPSERDERWDAINARLPQEVTVSPDVEADAHTTSLSSKLPEERLVRQLDGIGRAAAWQTAQPGQHFKLGERMEGVVLRLFSDKSVHHYDVVLELATKAKAAGFAGCVVDDAFVYAAVYRDSQLWSHDVDQTIIGTEIGAYLRSSNSIYLPEAEKNRLWVHDAYNAPPFVRPFFLYPLPPDLIVDMMWGRLRIFVCVNLGKLVAALRTVGLDADLPPNEEEFHRTFLPVSTEIHLLDNKRLGTRFHNLYYFGAQIMHEFLSLQGFVEQVSHLANTVVERAKGKDVYDVIFSSEDELTEENYN